MDFVSLRTAHSFGSLLSGPQEHRRDGEKTEFVYSCFSLRLAPLANLTSTYVPTSSERTTAIAITNPIRWYIHRDPTNWRRRRAPVYSHLQTLLSSCPPGALGSNRRIAWSVYMRSYRYSTRERTCVFVLLEMIAFASCRCSMDGMAYHIIGSRRREFDRTIEFAYGHDKLYGPSRTSRSQANLRIGRSISSS